MVFRSSILLLSAAAAVAGLEDPSIVSTPLGQVVGIVGPNYRVFEGVPYAAPPVGALRWQPPAPVIPWAPNTLNATQDPPGCIQQCYEDEPPHICPRTQSEDCLFLNIWTPVDATPTSALPVLIFIHGGNFHDGAAGGLASDGPLLYDGRTFVSNHEAIVVVLQYRLGALGFLYMGDSTTIGGNYGLMDQVEAFTWVQQYISYFGGDPSRVSLFGQSAGAMSISAHLTNLATTGLYTSVIQQSNPHGESYRDPISALGLANAFANFSGCNFADLKQAEVCLRGKDVATLLNAEIASETDILADIENILQIVVTWSPTIGTAYLPRRPLEAFQAGQVVDVPIMIGTTANETVIFVYEALNFPLDQPTYEIAAIVLFNYENFVQSQTLYPYPTPLPTDYRVFASYLLTDGLFLCPTRNASEALLVAQPYRKSPIYHYQYSHMLSSAPALWGANFTECDTEVCHGSDLPMWWHPNDPAIANYTASEDALSLTMETYWYSFAASKGQPNYAGGVSWPVYNASTRLTLNFETAEKGGITVIPNLRAEYCAWWDQSVGYHVY